MRLTCLTVGWRDENPDRKACAVTIAAVLEFVRGLMLPMLEACHPHYDEKAPPPASILGLEAGDGHEGAGSLGSSVNEGQSTVVEGVNERW